jgi:predicted RNA-binding protein YlxR (DUF448 family)
MSPVRLMARRPAKPKPGPTGEGPQRTCVACRRTGSPDSFVRLSVARETATDELSVAVGSLGGRGAWLCPTEACVAVLLKRRPLARALKVELSVPIYEALGVELRRLVSLHTVQM